MGAWAAALALVPGRGRGRPGTEASAAKFGGKKLNVTIKTERDNKKRGQSAVSLSSLSSSNCGRGNLKMAATPES